MPLEGKTKVEIEQLLRDYIATVNNPKYKGDMNVINSKFPEFQGMDGQLLQDYIATYNNPDYSGNYAIINEKFPEFFAGVGGTSTQETDPPVKKKDGMVSSSADGSSESQEVKYVSPEEFDKKTLYGESVDNATYVSPEKFDATSRGSAQDDFVRTIDANGGFKSREEVAQDDFVRAVDTDGGFKPREEIKFLTGEEADKRLDETLATAEWNQPKEAKEEIKYDPITKEQAAAADVATFPEYSQFEQADATRLDMPIGEAQAEQVKETIEAIKESQVPKGEESVFILEQERLKSEKEFREREELKRKKEQNLYSNAELEAIKFFKERGRDYEKDKALYDEYNEVRDALIFLEDAKYKFQEKDLTPEQRAKFGSAFYYNGVRRSDIVSLKRELNKRRDDLASAYLDDEAQQVREDFDQSVMVANKERIDNAVLVNNQAVANINKFNDKSIQKYGVSAEKLNTLKPQTIQEANDINLFIDDYNKAKLESQLAANQYEDASLYLETQFDKDNTLEFVDNFSAIKSQAKEGLSRGNAGDIILQYSMGITPDNEASTKEAAQKIVAALMQKPENKSRVMSRWEKANGFSEGFDVIADDPIEWAVSLAASSMSQMLPYGSKIVAATTATGAGAGAAAAGLAGAGAGAVYGLRAGMATTMFAMEYTNEVMDAISHFGYDISDPDSVAEALQDNKVWSRGRERGLKRGIPIAIADYLTASLAGKVIKVGSVASKAKRIGAMTAERLLVDPLGEAAGETVAQVTVGDELDFKEIVAEAGGGLGNNTSNMAINLARETKSKNKVDLANKLTDINFISKDISSDKQISDWSNNMERLGKIKPEINQRIQKNVGLRRDAKDLQDAAPIERIVYSGKNRAVRARIMTLLAAKEELSSTQNRRSVFGEKIREIDAEIASTVETGNLLPQEEQVVLAGQGVLSTTEQASATDVREALPEYRIKKGIRGKMVPVSKEEFLKRIDESSADELQKINATVTNDAEVVGILEEKLKEVKEDAIQEPSTETVDAQEPAESSPTMGETVPGKVTVTEPTEVIKAEVEEEVADIDEQAVEDFKSTIPDATKSETKTEQQQEEKADIVETFFEGEPSEDVSKVSGNLSINRIGEDTQKKSRLRNRVTAVAVKAAKSISKIIPETKIILHESNDEYLKYAKVGEGRAEYNPVQNIIHVNLSNATISTLPHEVFHAVLLNKVKTDEAAQKITKKMVDSVRKTLPDNNELAIAIDKFAAKYKGKQEQLQDEERISELIGLLASKEFGYSTLSKPAKNSIIEFFKNLAKRFGIKLGTDFGKTDESVIDLINTIAKKTVEGEAIEPSEIRAIEELDQGTTTPQSRQQKNYIDVDKVRANDRPGKRVSKGLSVRGTANKTITETDELSISYVKEEAPKAFIKNADILSKEELVSAKKKFGEITTIEQAQEVYDIFVREAADNLIFLTKKFNKKYKDIATLWYDGANIIANDLAKKYDVTTEQVAGIIASLSPQKDWYQNVRLAEMVLMTYKENPVMTQEMVDFQQVISERGLTGPKGARTIYKKSRTNENKLALEDKLFKIKQVQDALTSLIGTNIKDADKSFQAFYVRLHNELNTTKDYDVLRPDGKSVGLATKKDGSKSKSAWGSYTEIGKAVSIYNDGSQNNITMTLGQMHKIRNFYNNIIDPMSSDGDVTIDTHAVAAALLKPLSGKTKQVKNNFGTGTSNSGPKGVKGLYYAYSDAYALAAKELDLLPRQVQSITWEAVRGLFTDTFKLNKGKVKAINDIWEDYNNKKINIEDAREKTIERGEGINDPTWAESVSTRTEKSTKDNGPRDSRDVGDSIGGTDGRRVAGTRQSRQQRTERLAPNGKQSNLTDVQYDTVRTPAFKKWFGNWETDPENASKVVDENGEPTVVYHGSPSSDIDVFDRQRANEMASGIKEFGTYFATNKKLAELYKQGDGRVYPIFLNIRDMVTFDANGETNIEAWNNLKVKASYKTATNRDAMEFLSPVISKEKGLDGFGVEPVNGIKAENIIDIFIGLGSKQSENYIKAKKDYLGDVYLLFDGQPENAKLADGTNTTFKTESPSIRQQRQLSEESELMTSLNSIVEMGREQGIPDDSLKIILKEKGFKDSDINKALKVDIDLFTAMPKEFGNVEGGVEVGLKLFNETTEKTNKFSTEGPRGGVGTTRTKSFAEIREKAQEILKSNPIYKVQPEQVQLELQVALDRVLGIKKGPNVSRQIADIRNTLKQRKIGADTITDAQRSLRMFIRKVMPKSKNYSNTALNKLIKAVNNTTPKNFDGQVQVVLNQLEKQRQVLKNEVIDKIIKIARDKSKTARTSANRKRSKGLDAIGQSYFKEAKRVLDLVKNQDFEGLAAMQAEINEELITAALDNIEEGKTLTAKERALIDKQIALDTFADVMTMSLEEVNQLFEEVKTIRAESIARLNNRREARRIAVNNIKEKFNEQISEDFEELYNEEGEQLGKNILRNKREGIYKSFQAKGIWNKVIAFTDEFRENGKFRKSGKYDANGIIKFFRGSLQHLGTTTNILDRGKEGMFTKIFYNQLNDIDEKNLAGVFEQLDVMDSISNSEAGKVWGKWKYTLGTDVLILDGIKESKTGKTYREGLNRDQAMRLYALSLNPVQREKLQKQGFTEEKMKLIEDFIKPEGIGIANQIVDYFSNKYFNEVNNIYVQANDVNLGYVENYFPTRTISAQKKAADMISGDFSKVFTADTSPALQERTDTTGDVEIGMSFTDVVEQHIKDMERYKAYALGVKQMNEVYKSPDIQTLLQETGLFSIFNQNLNYAINPDAGPKTTSGVLSWIQRKFTGFALAFKPIQVLKQATSFVQAYEDYSFVKGKPIPGFDMVMFALDYAKVLSNLPKNIKESKEISATFKNRMKMGMEGDVFGLESGGRTYKKIGSQQGRRGAAVRGFKKAAGIFTVMGDILGVLGYKAVYNRNIANGMSKAEALSAFNNYNATQQTRRSTEKVALQQDNSFASKYFTMFGSTLFLQMNKTFQSANNIVKNFKPTKGEFGSLKDYRALALNVSVANALFTAAAYSGALLKGDDEDKDRAWQAIKDAALGLNILYQIPLAGTAIEEAVSKARGKRAFTSEGVNPFTSVSRKIQKSYKLLKDDEVIKAVKPIIELSIGAQFDSPIGIYNLIGGSGEDEDFYDALGITPSYRPGYGKRKSKKKSSKSQSKLKKSEVKEFFPDLYKELYEND